MPDKTIGGWLVVDWRAGSHRTRKSKPSASELGNNELLAKLSIDVHVPEVEIPELAVAIDVPEPHVRAATLEALDDEQLPGWTDLANDLLSSTPPEDPEEREREIDRVTLETLSESNTRPDPDAVREYVADAMHSLTTTDREDPER